MEIFGIRRRFREMVRNAREAEQLRVQLAGVTTAALGWSRGNEVKHGQYGWSPAYQDVLSLRQAWEKLWGRYKPEAVRSSKTRVIERMCCGYCGGVVWVATAPTCQIIIRAEKEHTIRVLSDVLAGTQVWVRMLREPEGQLMVEAAHDCHQISVL